MSALSENEADRSRRRDAILDAAYRRFSHFGYDHTSMEDIASEAGTNRPGVFSHFRDKDDIFRAVSQRLHDQALATARSARTEGTALPDALRVTLRAKVELALPTAGPPAKSTELLDPQNEVCGEICRTFAREYMALLNDVFAAGDAHGEVRLAARQFSAADAAALAHAAARGIIADHTDPATTHRRIEQFVTVLIVGLGGTEAHR
jgi:AcrR family transcriptional regulator